MNLSPKIIRTIISNRLIFVFLVFALCSCATVKNEYQLPPQDIESLLSTGKTRVIFFNSSNALLYFDGSWRIGIKVDGVGVENLHLSQYVQLELEPGIHKLELSHVDLFTFRDSYVLNVRDKTMYIEVYNSITSTEFKILDEEPKDFKTKYKPVEVG
jgi:hypothetical protein